jgi:hypothetical protein
MVLTVFNCWLNTLTSFNFVKRIYSTAENFIGHSDVAPARKVRITFHGKLYRKGFG